MSSGGLPQSVLALLGEETVAELAALLPSLAAPVSAPAGPRLGTERYRTHYAIRALLERLGAQEPTVLALDDLHWADDASIEVIGHLIRRFQGPLLGAFAFRRAPAGLAAFLDSAQRAGSASRLDLAPLSVEEAAALFESDVEGPTRAALYEESGGNPFDLEELQHAASVLHVFATPASGEAGVPTAPPPSVVVVIREELAALPEDVRGVLESAAVVGDAFEPDLVASVAGTPEPAALAAIDRLLEADLVRPTDVPRRSRFRHPIVRRAVYEGARGVADRRPRSGGGAGVGRRPGRGAGPPGRAVGRLRRRGRNRPARGRGSERGAPRPARDGAVAERGAAPAAR
jgi:hypothetical protein